MFFGHDFRLFARSIKIGHQIVSNRFVKAAESARLGTFFNRNRGRLCEIRIFVVQNLFEAFKPD